MKTTMRLLGYAMAAAFITACSDANSGSGRVEAMLSDNPVSTAAPMFGDGARASESAPDAFSGSLTGTAQVSISTNGSAWVDLSQPSSITMNLQSGNGTTVHGQVEVPVGTYARVRVVFRNAQANLSAGSVIGGVTLTSQATIMLGDSDGEVVCEKTVTPFTVRAGATTHISFDLNAETWMNSQVLQAQAVADAAVQAALAASVSSS